METWPPVLEYTWVSSTSTLMSIPAASIRESDWKPMSYIAPSPPTTQRRFSCQPRWSHLARTPMATAGAFSKREFVQGTRKGL